MNNDSAGNGPPPSGTTSRIGVPPDPALAPPALPRSQPRNPLHGVTLKDMVTALSNHYGWPGLAERIPLRCFTHDPSITSSLTFLRKTPWARDKVEGLYRVLLRAPR